MSSKKHLSDRDLQNILENDSASDSEDEMGDFLHSPSNTYINLSENGIIDHQLERLFEGGMEEAETILESTEVVSDEIDEDLKELPCREDAFDPRVGQCEYEENINHRSDRPYHELLKRSSLGPKLDRERDDARRPV